MYLQARPISEFAVFGGGLIGASADKIAHTVQKLFIPIVTPTQRARTIDLGIIRDRGNDLYVGMRVVKMFCMYKRYTSKNLKTRYNSQKRICMDSCGYSKHNAAIGFLLAYSGAEI